MTWLLPADIRSQDIMKQFFALALVTLSMCLSSIAAPALADTTITVILPAQNPMTGKAWDRYHPFGIGSEPDIAVAVDGERIDDNTCRNMFTCMNDIPDRTAPFKVTVFNGNAIKADNLIGSAVCTPATKSCTPLALEVDGALMKMGDVSILGKYDCVPRAERTPEMSAAAAALNALIRVHRPNTTEPLFTAADMNPSMVALSKRLADAGVMLEQIKVAGNVADFLIEMAGMPGFEEFATAKEFWALRHLDDAEATVEMVKIYAKYGGKKLIEKAKDEAKDQFFDFVGLPKDPDKIAAAVENYQKVEILQRADAAYAGYLEFNYGKANKNGRCNQ